jgi:hypothetical protein
MRLCRICEYLYEKSPFGFVRGLLIRGHMENCPVCRAGLASPEEVRSILAQARDFAGRAGIWAAIQSRLKTEKPEAGLAPAAAGSRLLRWASAVGMIVAISAGAFWLFRNSPVDNPRRESPSPEVFRLDDLRVGGEPARAIIYQPRNSDMVVVWAEKNGEESESKEISL